MSVSTTTRFRFAEPRRTAPSGAGHCVPISPVVWPGDPWFYDDPL